MDSTAKREKLLVTSALPYANGPIHFGHISGAYLGADIYVRYKKMCDADIVYICGTDDHGVAITITAEALNRTPAEHVRINHEIIKTIFDRMNIRFDNFSQTSRPAHAEISVHFFKRLLERGLIEEKDTEQFFCATCNRYLADRYITGKCPHCGHEGARGDECGGCGAWLDPFELIEPKCKICGAAPEVRTTKNWYLKLADRAEWLEKWIHEAATRDDLPWKKIVTTEVQGYLKRGLQSRAITRDLDWGIPVPLPGADGKVLYVWFDAPIGYISSTREYFEAQGQPSAKWEEYWKGPDTKLIHFIGKDNIPFHAMIFPIMLDGMDEGYVIPHFVAGNAFLNLEGKQFSKSEHWYIDPLEFLDRYHVDSIRYYLCAEMPESSDSEFRWKSFQACHNNELTNIYANLVNRTLKFIATKLDGKVPACNTPRDSEASPWKQIGEAAVKVGAALDEFKFRPALHEMLALARAGNKFFDEQQPWKTLTENPDACNAAIRACLVLIKTLAVVSAPFIPDTAQRVWSLLGLAGNVAGIPWAEAANDPFTDGAQLPEPDILFKRIEDKQIAEEEKKLGIGLEKENAKASEKKKKQDVIPGVKKIVNIDDFAKLDIRVGHVLEAGPVPGSSKMLKLLVDIGIEKRQILAGIAKYYTPEQITGRKIAVIVNLEPRAMMGLESQGMVLAASAGDSLSVMSFDCDLPPGARIS